MFFADKRPGLDFGYIERELEKLRLGRSFTEKRRAYT